ncbi:MAG: AAA family ATPase [Bacilli bacterium]|nr:AAA family ATPase [Bacilli bacterium]
MNNKLYIITGPAGVGKSTVSKEIAETLEKTVLIEGDDIYNQFISGRISPYKEEAPLDLFWQNCTALINNYLKDGYTVIFNYIVKQKELEKLKQIFKEYYIIFAVLLTDEETIIKRDKERPVDCQMGERSLILLQEFIEENYCRDNILDTTKLSISEIADKIIKDKRFHLNKIKLEEIKKPEDILQYMKDNIEYGWLDSNGEEHIGNMKGFRTLYRTSSLETILKHKLGTCIEQVWLMKYLFDKLQIPSKMFCTRIYEGKDFNKLEEEEHMHCFLLYYVNDKVYHMEHPNFKCIGIYEYNKEEEAIQKINAYYEEMSGSTARPVTEFFTVEPNLTFKEFNMYINHLDEK